jgi:hypothetical protein
LIAVLVAAVSVSPALAATNTPPPPPQTPPVLLATPPAVANPYVNPFANPSWSPSRTDMGMDWIEAKRLPVVAIGDAVIVGSDNHSPWPGKHIIWYQLLDGSHAGDIVYVAEHLTKLAKAGTVVKAGQQIATALPGFPWTEWGWADQYGSPRALRCYKEGKATNSGREMSRFLQSLGALAGDPAGRGPSTPSGKLC